MEKNLKISCSLHDEKGNRISETNIHEENNDEKGFYLEYGIVMYIF